MVQKTTPPAGADGPVGEEKPPEVTELLHRVGRFLETGDAGAAMDVIDRSKVRSPWATNAVGVCLLRLGQAARAVGVYRGLVLAGGGLALRTDVPIVFKANYARALLAADNLAGFLSVLGELRRDAHPAARRLTEAFDRWRQALPVWQAVRWYPGGQPDPPPTLDQPLGQL